ncbi:MAG: hypothetical protein HKN67_02425, partial [Saprospiraceae bacterium]|nr:hypothetical protein [Saprospiraceae bacterium]
DNNISSTLKHTVYLVGDAGELDDPIKKRNFVLDEVNHSIKTESKESSVVYLGDNLYPKGLVKKDDPDRQRGEDILMAQIDVTKNTEANTYFIPGNHDWKKYTKGGLKYLKRQEDYIKDNRHNKKVKFYPKNGCGDPEVVKVDNDLVMIFTDTQWWLADWEKEKKINKGCEIKSRRAFIDELEELFVKYKNKQIVLFVHHPFHSNGNHGGYYSLKQHLFPLQELNSSLWIPLPIIGSIYPLYRSVSGHRQDIPNPLYQELIDGITEAAHVAKNVIVASGHEHILQYTKKAGIHHIISGSGSRKSFGQKGADAEFVYAERGYSKLNFYDNGEVWLEFYSVESFGTEQKLKYRQQIIEPKAGTVKDKNAYPSSEELPEQIIAAANKKFKSKGFKEFWLGEQYRDMWATNIDVPAINLSNVNGGLVPIKKGGGMASNSLRMENPDGHHYILRSINKDYTKLLPENFKNLKLVNIMKDQNSASHPYGALMIPTLSRAAGIYYTEPRLVYLPHQEQLGNYNDLFPEELYLLEQRPSGDWSQHEPFGNSENIISYADLLTILQTKKKHFIDQEWVLKSRLFDIWIHDWDRHDDQWRWASFKEENKTIYRPIPRDRDQVFYKFEGLLPRLIAIYGVRSFKTMDDVIRDVPGLSTNARTFDRYFLNELEWSDWEEIVETLQSKITIADIDAAFKDLPPEVRALNKEEIKNKLIRRKNDLKKYARKHYEFINKEVQVVGSDNKEDFYVERNANGTVDVRVFVRDDGEQILKFERNFTPDVTKEIRFFGLDGKDHFILQGDSNNKIKLRIIGGEGKDQITDKTGGQIVKTVKVYDDLNGITVEEDLSFKDFTSETDLEVNEYDRSYFEYNTGLPFLLLGYTPDDLFWIGAGGSFTKQGWRKDPFASKHTYSASYSPAKSTFIIKYNGIYTDKVFRNLDLITDLSVLNPFFINYFGLGNNSVDVQPDNRYNWVRMFNYSANIKFQERWKRSFIKFGPGFNTFKLVNVEDRVLDDIENPGDGFFERDYFATASFEYGLEAVDKGSNPGHGIRFNAGAEYAYNIDDDNDFTSIWVDGSFYLTLLAKPRLTFATKAAYAKVFGDPKLYQMPAIGNNNGLRAFRNERFRGESSLIHQFDLRLHLFSWNNPVLPMSIGVMGGYDYGRVWLEDELFDGFHTGYTFGLSLNILDMAVLHPYYSISDDNEQLSVRLGFSF